MIEFIKESFSHNHLREEQSFEELTAFFTMLSLLIFMVTTMTGPAVGF